MVNTAKKITLNANFLYIILIRLYNFIVLNIVQYFSALYSDQYITAKTYCNLTARIGGAITVLMLINVRQYIKN
jgi:hypothetical protein